MLSFLLVWTNCWIKCQFAGDLRRHDAGITRGTVKKLPHSPPFNAETYWIQRSIRNPWCSIEGRCCDKPSAIYCDHRLWGLNLWSIVGHVCNMLSHVVKGLKLPLIFKTLILKWPLYCCIFTMPFVQVAIWEMSTTSSRYLIIKLLITILIILALIQPGQVRAWTSIHIQRDTMDSNDFCMHWSPDSVWILHAPLKWFLHSYHGKRL